MAGPASVSTLMLRNVPLFSALPDEQLSLLARAAGRKSFPHNATVISAGDPSDALYLVVAGRLKVMMSDEEGREVILAILSAGECFGEMSVIDDAPRSATVTAIDPCELVVISKYDFKKCLAENSGIAEGVMKVLVKRLREADNKIGSLALMDVCGRVARLLMEMADTVDGQKVIKRKLAKQDIAKMVGASRETVSRAMKHLQNSGYIELRSGEIHLHAGMLIPVPKA